jgi:hypothetical protein
LDHFFGNCDRGGFAGGLTTTTRGTTAGVAAITTCAAFGTVDDVAEWLTPIKLCWGFACGIAPYLVSWAIVASMSTWSWL